VTQFFSLLLKPFENGHAHGGLIFISLITGAVMLFLFKLTSNQQAMKEAKAKISAFFMEMRLYQDDFSAIVASQRRVFRANLTYTKLALIPAAVMIVPVILIMTQLNLRYGQSALSPGDETVVSVEAEEGYDVVRDGIRLSVGDGLEKSSPAVRIASLGETSWKVRVTGGGIHDLTLSTTRGDATFPVYGTRKSVPIFTGTKKLSFSWEGLGEVIMNPGAPRIPKDVPIKSVKLTYPEMSFNWGFIKLSWLWSFLIISMAFGVILKFALKVE
jgi:uncharacterized membrane protein (DUF106 family)